MSKITFRADEELVERIEARDASKSEIMREALREYLDREDSSRASADARATSAERERDVREYDAHAATPRQSDVGTRQPAGVANEKRGTASALDAVLADRVDELVSQRLDAWEARRRDRASERAQDVNVNVTLESDAPVPGADADASADANRTARPSDEASDDATARQPTGQDASSETTCGQCGEGLSDDHVYCPNCGEKASRRVFCECGDEVRSDWGFCPSCGRRTPAADVLDQP
jgi:predicted transcriptional regulator